MKRYPIKFLDAYSKNDTDIFFGRKDEVDALYKMVYQTDILLVYGASGTGKTSLIQCGLASRFESHDWLDLYVRRGNDINESLKNTLIKAGGKIEEAEADWFDIDLEDDEEEVVTQKPLSELQLQFKTIYLHAFRPIYLIFDQFEELYILGNKAEQQQFVENVKSILALEQPIKIIFSIREEYLGHLYDFERAIPQLLKKKLRVEPMNITKVQEVIAGTTMLKNSNVSMKEGELEAFTATIFERLQGKDEDGNIKKSLTIDLPYLQVFLDKIYLEITKDRTRTTEAEFSLAALKNIGEIGDVLRQFLEEQVVSISRQLRPKHRTLQAKHIWQILSPFVTLDGTKEPISTEIIQEKVKNTVENSNDSLTFELIETLIKSQIIRYLENDETYEIAHDSLAAKISEKRTNEEIALLEVGRLIKSQAAIKADARELFSEKQLNFIEPYLGQLVLNETEKNLLAESREQIRLNKIAEKEAQTAELKAARAQARKERSLRSRTIYLAIFTFVLTIVGAYFYISADNKRKEAELTQKSVENHLFKAFVMARHSDEKPLFKKKVLKTDDIIKSDTGYEYNFDSIRYSSIDKFELNNWKLQNIPNDIIKCENLKSLSINNNEISDLSFLDSLNSLTHLYLSTNHISNISSIGKSTSLTHLYLFKNQIKDISSIGNLTNLTQLHLSKNQIKDIKPIGKLRNLTQLHLSKNQIKDIKPIGKLRNLTQLYLANNEFSTINAIGNLKKLNYLNLSNTKVSKIDTLGNLTALNYLDLSSTDVDNVSAMRNLKKLDYLDLSNTNISNIDALKDLEKLNYLDLSNTKVSKIDTLGNLTHLNYLDLSNTDVSNINVINNLTLLDYLDLSYTKVSKIDSIGKLDYLDLSNTQISNIDSIIRSVTLTYLDLSNTGVSNIEMIDTLIKLTYLNLSNTEILNIDSIANLTSLTKLDLSNNAKFSNIDAIVNLKKLTELDLSNTKVSDKSIKTLQKLTTLTKLYLYNTQISKAEIKKLKKMLPNCKILSN